MLSLMTQTLTSGTIQITDQQRRDYIEKGYFLLERIIPESHLEILRQTAADYIAAIHAEMDARGTDVIDINHRNRRYFVSNKWKTSPRMGEFIFSNYMADICRATLGSEAYLFNEQYVIKAAERGMKFAWHQDSGYVGHPHREYLTCWCALDDMTVENGTVFMLPFDRAGGKTVTKHQKETGTNDLVGYFGEDPGDPVICPAGSIAVFSSVCFHRSTPNTTNRMRRVYLAQYTAEPLMNRENTRTWAFADPFLKNGQVTPEALKWREPTNS
jgi:ectoine hydroxylase-related dioxygenase (phytanoyl-CoA dioxygenase family)